MNYWQKRIVQEVAILAVRFGNINYDEKRFAWIQLPDFELPPGWNQLKTDLLIELPAAYPEVPPDGFFINKNLRPTNGRTLEHYFQDQSQHNRLAHLGWAWYCIHPDKFIWTPSVSISRGDNLLKYIELIRLVLTEAVH